MLLRQRSPLGFKPPRNRLATLLHIVEQGSVRINWEPTMGGGSELFVEQRGP